MQLTSFTDFSLRSLMYLNRTDKLVTLDELSEALGVSRNHLVKVTNRLSKEGLIETIRGRFGGMRIHPKTASMKLGDILLITEERIGLADCHRNAKSECPFLPRCKLKRSLDRALHSFLDSLNQHTIDGIT